MARAEEVGSVHAVARSGPWRRAEGALGVDLVQDRTVPGGVDLLLDVFDDVVGSE
jgi:hypothetical protein